MNHVKVLTFLLLLILSTTAVNAHDFKVDDIYYNFINKDAGTVEVTFKGGNHSRSSNRYKGDVVIPERVVYKGATYAVKCIGDWAFYDCDKLTNVTLPDGIVIIGQSAFSSCI